MKPAVAICYIVHLGLVVLAHLGQLLEKRFGQLVVTIVGGPSRLRAC
jgi:hypothetical protein